MKLITGGILSVYPTIKSKFTKKQKLNFKHHDIPVHYRTPHYDMIEQPRTFKDIEGQYYTFRKTKQGDITKI